MSRVENFDAAPAGAASSAGLRNEIGNTTSAERNRAYAAMSATDTTSKFLSPAPQLFDSATSSDAIKMTPAQRPMVIDRPPQPLRGDIHGTTPKGINDRGLAEGNKPLDGDRRVVQPIPPKPIVPERRPAISMRSVEPTKPEGSKTPEEEKRPQDPKDPDHEYPADPGDEDPKEPEDEYPEDPGDEDPKEPEDEYPEDPGDEDPKEPEDEYPEDPGDEDPKEPEDEYPEDPGDEDPKEPEDEYPEDPGDEGDDPLVIDLNNSLLRFPISPPVQLPKIPERSPGWEPIPKPTVQEKFPSPEPDPWVPTPRPFWETEQDKVPGPNFEFTYEELKRFFPHEFRRPAEEIKES